MWSHHTCSRRQLRRATAGMREAGWGAAGGEPTARRRTNPIRRCAVASLLMDGEACARKSRPVERGDRHVTTGLHYVVGGGMPGRQDGWTGEACGAGEAQQESEPA
jgi:hypothetical protein